MLRTLATAVTAGLMAFASVAHAEEWPARPVTMINPFAAGGPNDVLARLFAQRMGELLGQPVVLENVGGAGGMNGADRVAKAIPDGYTFLLGTVGTQAQNQSLFKKPAYNSTTDFEPVALIVEAPLGGTPARLIGTGLGRGGGGHCRERRHHRRQSQSKQADPHICSPSGSVMSFATRLPAMEAASSHRGSALKGARVP